MQKLFFCKCSIIFGLICPMSLDEMEKRLGLLDSNTHVHHSPKDFLK